MAGAAEAPATSRQVWIVLLVSGAIGFFFGVTHAAWQDALEAPQVLAGLVRYPVSTPVYVFSVKTWTVLDQLLTLAFHWGVSERTLTLVVSGVVGMLSLQALAVFVLALGGSVAWAVLSSFFLYFTSATAGGVTYPSFCWVRPSRTVPSAWPMCCWRLPCSAPGARARAPCSWDLPRPSTSRWASCL